MAHNQQGSTDQSSEQRTSTRSMLSWAFYDWANNGFVTLITTFLFSAYFTREVATDVTSGTQLWGNAIGIAGIITAVSAPVLGAVADQLGRRKPFIAVFTLLCVIATASLWFVQPTTDWIWPALILLMIASIFSALAVVFYNALLPVLARPSHIGRWSGWGWALGYFGGLVALALVYLAFVRETGAWVSLPRENFEHVRIAFLCSALWYALFSLPLLFFTHEPPAPKVPLRKAMRDGMRQIKGSLSRVRRYANLVRFLVARMLFIDGLATLFALGGVYAAGTFDMTLDEVLTFGIVLNITAGLGAFGFAWVDDYVGARRTILLALTGLTVSGAALLVVESRSWFWGLALVLGLFIGPVQSASRSYMARMAPPELRNEMFGLLALSAKATAFTGPLLVAALTAWSESQRVGMSAIIILFVLGLLLMLRVETDITARGNS